MLFPWSSCVLQRQAEEARRLLDDAKSRYQLVSDRLVAEGRTTEELEVGAARYRLIGGVPRCSASFHKPVWCAEACTTEELEVGAAHSFWLGGKPACDRGAELPACGCVHLLRFTPRPSRTPTNTHALPPPHPAPVQRERGAAAAQLAEAKARINEVLDQLAAERSQTAALKVRMRRCRGVAEAPVQPLARLVQVILAPSLQQAAMGLCSIRSGSTAHSSICPSSPSPQAQATEAAQQLAEANSRYRTALEQLQAERARADALQVRSGRAWGCCAAEDLVLLCCCCRRIVSCKFELPNCSNFAVSQSPNRTATSLAARVQAERDAVAAELAEARSRYSWALAELEAERARSSMLEVRNCKHLQLIWNKPAACALKFHTRAAQCDLQARLAVHMTLHPSCHASAAAGAGE